MVFSHFCSVLLTLQASLNLRFPGVPALSVVIYVVKAAFVPFSATMENPANAGAARLYGVSPCPVPDSATALPNCVRQLSLLYQLFTRFARGGNAADGWNL